MSTKVPGRYQKKTQRYRNEAATLRAENLKLLDALKVVQAEAAVHKRVAEAARAIAEQSYELLGLTHARYAVGMECARYSWPQGPRLATTPAELHDRYEKSATDDIAEARLLNKPDGRTP